MKTEDKLQKLRGYYESAANHPVYQQWLQEAKAAWQFYDGQQWSDDEKQKLAEHGQPAIVINKVATKVDNITGAEMAGRTRIVFRSRSGDEQEEETARALTDLSLYVNDQTGASMELSGAFKSGLVCGVGWVDIGADKPNTDEAMFIRHEDALSVVFDPSSRRDDFSDARFICRQRWLDEDDVRAMFGKKGEQLVANSQHASQQVTQPSAYADILNNMHNTTSYFDPKRQLYRVVEVQYKQTEKRYTVTESSGNTWQTFHRDAAFSDVANTVETQFVPRVYVGYFSENMLLSHHALPYAYNDFTLLPYVYKRQRVDGLPYGLMRAAMDPQRELNKRRSKAMHLLNTAQVIADIDAVEDPNTLAKEAARPDGLILKRTGKDLRILRNTDLAQSQVTVMEKAAADIQEVMGVFDESIGKQSNATSGVAIQQRQMANSLNQMFAFDSLRKTKKALGMRMLSLIRQYMTHSMVLNIADRLQAARVVKLNAPVQDEMGNIMKDADGNPVLKHDVRHGVFDVHVEEVKDVTSSREFELQQLNSLIAAGVPVPHSALIEATTLRNKQDLLTAVQSVTEAPQPK